jgi:hypothetical protein
MNVISDRLARDYPEEDKGWGAIVTELRDRLVGDVRPALLTLLGAVGFVLLIACANTANLVPARTIARRKELATAQRFAPAAAAGASVPARDDDSGTELRKGLLVAGPDNARQSAAE